MSIHANYIYSPVPKLDVGIEYMYASANWKMFVRKYEPRSTLHQIRFLTKASKSPNYLACMSFPHAGFFCLKILAGVL